MKKFSKMKKQTYIFILTLSLLMICLGILFINTYKFNSQQRVIKYDLNTTQEQKESGDCLIEIAPRGGSTDTWIKRMTKNTDGEKSEIQYAGIIYDILITNQTNEEVKNWTVKVDIPQDCYINNAWCGTVEFHQDTANDEKIQTIDLRKWHENNVEFIVDASVAESDLLIPMYTGDYFIYHPSAEVYEDYITPSATDLDLYQSKRVDFIAYHLTSDGDTTPMEFPTLEFTYYLNKSLWDMPLFWMIIILFGLWVLMFLMTAAVDMKTRKLISKAKHDKIIIEQSMTAFMGFIDAKDPSTNGHSLRVAKYSQMIARRMGLSNELCDRIYYIGLMHDCGKIGIPDAILKKPSKLTPEEYEIIKTHTTQGAKILKDFTSIPDIKDGALYHHERYDGKGYPCGLKGEEIPFIARIICVADSYDVMNSTRYYKTKATREDIIEEMVKNRGTQFDPEIVDCFLSMINEL